MIDIVLFLDLSSGNNYREQEPRSTTMATKSTMQAVVFKGPHHIVVEERPIPRIREPRDIIVKVIYTALCGRYVLLICLLDVIKSTGEKQKMRLYCVYLFLSVIF